MPRESYTYQHLKREIGRAISRYDMLQDGDRVAVGLSGGKDSLTLLWFLHERLARIPIGYELVAIFLDPGFEGGFSAALEAFCGHNGYDLRVEHTDFGVRAHGPANRENPCFLCSRLRRRRLFEMAEELNCNKVALGHNKDDFIETLFMNMCYAGELSTMLPYQTFFEDKFKLIRPLVYAPADVIRRFAAERRFPDFVNPCPSARASKRSEIRDLLAGLYRGNRKIRGNLFRALHNVKRDYLL